MAPVVVSPPPEQCTYWTQERVDEFGLLSLDSSYPRMSEMITEWSATCGANAAMVGKPWLEVLDPAPARPWWRVW